MRRFLVAATATATLFGVISVGPAEAEENGLTITIASPVSGDFVEPEFQLQGTVTGLPVPPGPTTVAYVVDVSGSTANAGVGCSGGNRILDCEIDAVTAVDSELQGNPSAVQSGVGWFNNTGVAFDFDEGDYLRPPGMISAAITALEGTNPAGGTNFTAGMSVAETILGEAATDSNIVVFLTDGQAAAAPAARDSLPAGTVVRAFQIGSAGCSSGLSGTLDLGVGDTCVGVTGLGQLTGAVIDNVVVPTFEYSIDGVVVGAVPLDENGEFDVAVGPVAVDSQPEVCVFPAGDQGNEASDCVSVESVEQLVDCAEVSGTCTASAEDPGVSTADFAVDGSDEMVGIRAAECPETDCVTSYDVLFSTTTGSGPVAELIVVTERAVSTPPGQAAVFITVDGVETEITATCKNTIAQSSIPCAKIKRIEGGETQYLVRFASDPGFRFR